MTMIRTPAGMRLAPVLPPQAYRTFRVVAPLSSHWVKAACREIGCDQWREGWTVHVEAVGPHLEHAARTSGRKFAEVKYAEGMTLLLFEAGQPCFAESRHRRRLERDERWLIQNGDWRGDPDHFRPREVSSLAWRDEFGEHQERLADQTGGG
jgi:hypothetical protein